MAKKTPEEIAALKAKYAAENAAKEAKRADKKNKYFKEPEPYELPEYLKTIENLDRYSSVWSPDGWYTRKTAKRDTESGVIYYYLNEWSYIPH